ncbi:hypothetical protein BDR22DRAFT_179733 [Usnea florida]
MSSSQTHEKSSRGVEEDADTLFFEQIAPASSPESITSSNSKDRRASMGQGSCRDHGAEKKKSLEPPRKRTTPISPNSRPTGHSYETNHEALGAESADKSDAQSIAECSLLSQSPNADSPEVLGAERGNRAARTTHKSKSSQSRAAVLSHLPRRSRKTRAPPKHRSGAGPGDDPWPAAAAYKHLQERIMSMPAEICQMIMDMVFEEAFGPRRIHPHKDPPVMNVFLALDRAFYRKCHEQYWTKNTWIVSKGPLNKTMRFMTEKPYNESTTEFSLQTPNKAALQIRSVELSFSNADTPDLLEWQQLAEESAAAPTPYMTPRALGQSASSQSTNHHDAVQPLQVVQNSLARAQRYDAIRHQLIHTWQDKFDRVAMLNLAHLTLDFTEAYDPVGRYLGVYLVRRLIPFAHGMPGQFQILAPDGWIERQIRDAFLVLNAG